MAPSSTGPVSAFCRLDVKSLYRLLVHIEWLDIDLEPDVGRQWVKDYGAPENGGLMYVQVDELRREVASRL